MVCEQLVDFCFFRSRSELYVEIAHFTEGVHQTLPNQIDGFFRQLDQSSERDQFPQANPSLMDIFRIFKRL
jgi:hypothetical protein